MEKPKVLVAGHLDKISEIIDIKTGDKLDKIKGNVIEKKKEFNINEIPTEEVKTMEKKSSLSEKIEQKINDKINELLDKKIDEIFSKMF